MAATAAVELVLAAVVWCRTFDGGPDLIDVAHAMGPCNMAVVQACFLCLARRATDRHDVLKTAITPSLFLLR